MEMNSFQCFYPEGIDENKTKKGKTPREAVILHTGRDIVQL